MSPSRPSTTDVAESSSGISAETWPSRLGGNCSGLRNRPGVRVRLVRGVGLCVGRGHSCGCAGFNPTAPNRSSALSGRFVAFRNGRRGRRGPPDHSERCLCRDPGAVFTPAEPTRNTDRILHQRTRCRITDQLNATVSLALTHSGPSRRGG